MNYVRYHLQPYTGRQSRHQCPGCKHRSKTFKRYIHPETNEELAPHVGLCDRVLNCGYHYTPRQYFAAMGYTPNTCHPKRITPYQPQPDRPTSYIDVETVNQSLDNYQHNNFVLHLIDRLGVDIADALVKRYLIGTSTRWPGATIFWQIDITGNIRTGKIMLYDKRQGKRVKKPYNHVTWAHTQSGTTHYNLKQCLFGEHLLINNHAMPIALVESEKTAIISSAAMPGFIWLATGGLDGLDITRCSALRNRQVVLFPDANGFNKWQQKAIELQRAMPGTVIKVSNYLEATITNAQREAGIDLVDVLIMF